MTLKSQRFNEADSQSLAELEKLLGISGTFGSEPKAIKIAIKVTINLIKQHRKSILNVTPTLTASQIALLLPSLVNIEKQQEYIKNPLFSTKQP